MKKEQTKWFSLQKQKSLKNKIYQSEDREQSVRLQNTFHTKNTHREKNSAVYLKVVVNTSHALHTHTNTQIKGHTHSKLTHQN